MLTIEEKSIISIYLEESPSRLQLITALEDSLPHLDDTELCRMTKNAIKKLDIISDDEFSQIEYSDIIIAE